MTEISSHRLSGSLLFKGLASSFGNSIKDPRTGNKIFCEGINHFARLSYYIDWVKDNIPSEQMCVWKVWIYGKPLDLLQTYLNCFRRLKTNKCSWKWGRQYMSIHWADTMVFGCGMKLLIKQILFESRSSTTLNQRSTSRSASLRQEK